MPLNNKNLRKLINIGLKVAQLVLAGFYMGVVSYPTTINIYNKVFIYGHRQVMSFVTITAGFMISTFLLLVIQLHAQSTEKQRKSLFEFLFNICAVILLVSASSRLLSFSEGLTYNFPGRGAWRAGGIMGLMNTALYSASAVLAFFEYNKTD